MLGRRCLGCGEGEGMEAGRLLGNALGYMLSVCF